MFEALFQAFTWGLMGAVTLCAFIGAMFALLVVGWIVTAPIRAIKKRLK